MKQRNISSGQNLTADAAQPITSLSLEEQIRLRAYELYEQRGRQDGFAEQDWLQAEAELTKNTLRAAA